MSLSPHTASLRQSTPAYVSLYYFNFLFIYLKASSSIVQSLNP